MHMCTGWANCHDPCGNLAVGLLFHEQNLNLYFLTSLSFHNWLETLSSTLAHTIL